MIFYKYAFDVEKALKEGLDKVTKFTQITDYDYFIVNSNFEDYNIPQISGIDKLEKRQDYYEDLGKYILYFLRNTRYNTKTYKQIDYSQRIILRKNKIYPLNYENHRKSLDRTVVKDEFGEEFNIADTCYETYLFIKEKDVEIARNQLKLNLKLKKIK